MTTLQEAAMRQSFETWAKPILGDNPTWKESGECELAWQSWKAALAQQAATKNCPQPEICGSKECEFCRDTAAPAPQAQEPTAWRTEALKWIRRKAEDQRATNEQNPRHAEAYPSWGERVRHWHWLADELELEQNSTSFGLEPYQEPAPQPAPQPAQEPVKFLVNGTRFKLSFDTRGRVSSLWNFMDELDGRWVALVAAEDDCHLQSTQPKQEPLTDEEILSLEKQTPAMNDAGEEWIYFARAIEASHGINGMVEAATRSAIDAASKQGGQHE